MAKISQNLQLVNCPRELFTKHLRLWIEFEWARQSMISMQLAANYYENILDIQASKNPKFSGLNGREIAMHQNMMWIFQVMAKVIY